ncbi:Spy/CpxP family protein refolding chaperone [Winogradskyella sp. PE311]|uniref:Spy/CpxP family protein refolding chaperone n=1 Tax=Winogradskyella sp. PE311 TaxID=3366943 RepID=UPI0039819468
MKRNTVLYVLIIFLIIANGFFLFNYIGNNNHKGPETEGRDKEFLVKELNFNDAQLAEFREKSKDHREIMILYSDDIKRLKDELFSHLSNELVNDSVIDSITLLIGEKERQKDREVFNHFKMIQEICNNKQKEKFKVIIKDAMRQGERRQRPPRGNNNGQRPPPPPR